MCILPYLTRSSLLGIKCSGVGDYNSHPSAPQVAYRGKATRY